MRPEPARPGRCTRRRARGAGHGAPWASPGSAAPRCPGWLTACPGRAGRTPHRGNMPVWEPHTRLLRQRLDALARPAVPAQPLPADRPVSGPSPSRAPAVARYWAFTASRGIGMRVRRVVTGHDRNGKAVFASDEDVDPLTVELIPGAEFHRLWGADQAPTFPDGGGPTAQPSYFPPV